MIIIDDRRAIGLQVSVSGIVSLRASLAVVNFGCVMVTAHSGCTGVSAVSISEQLNHGDMAFHLLGYYFAGSIWTMHTSSRLTL